MKRGDATAVATAPGGHDVQRVAKRARRISAELREKYGLIVAEPVEGGAGAKAT